MRKIRKLSAVSNAFLALLLAASILLPQQLIFADGDTTLPTEQPPAIELIATNLALKVTHVTDGTGQYRGGSVKLEATLTDAVSTPIIGASVKFKVNGGNNISRKTDSNGVAVLENYTYTNPLSDNIPYTFTAEYAGSTIYSASQTTSEPTTIVTQYNPNGLYSTATFSNTGKILGFDNSKSYEYANTSYVLNSTIWQPIDGNSLTGLAYGTYFVRLKAYTDGNTFYRASANDVYVDVKKADFTVTPSVSEGVKWSSVTPAEVVRVGEAKFTVSFDKDYVFDSASLAYSGYGEVSFNKETSTVTVSKVTRDQTVTVKAVNPNNSVEPTPTPTPAPPVTEPVDGGNGEAVIPVQTILNLSTVFRPSTTHESDDAGFVDYTATLTDENGAPIKGATIYYEQITAPPGSRVTDSNGVSTGYGAAFYPANKQYSGTYEITAKFKGGLINGVNYAPVVDKKTINIVQRPKPVIYDNQVVASKSDAKKGKFLNLDNGLEYVEWIISYGIGQKWITVENNQITGLNPTIYTFRYKEYIDGNTFYLASPESIISLPRGEWTVTPLAGEHLIWESLEPIDIAPDSYGVGYINSAYFKVKPEDGYKITGVSADKGSSYYRELSYNQETGVLSLIKGSAYLNLSVAVEKIDDVSAPVVEAPTNEPDNSATKEAKVTILSDTGTGVVATDTTTNNNETASDVPSITSHHRAYSSNHTADKATDVINEQADNKGTQAIAPAVNNPYIDVNKNDWFYEGALLFANLGFVEGDSFRPNSAVDGRKVLKVISAIDKNEDVTTKDIDVKDLGFEFNEVASLTREKTITLLYKYANDKGEVVDTHAKLLKFEDASQISDWALPAFRWAVVKGIIKGRSADTFDPKSEVTNSELATIVQRYLANDSQGK